MRGLVNRCCSCPPLPATRPHCSAVPAELLLLACDRLQCRSAFVQNFDVVFLSDGTSTSSQEAHAATLLNIGFAFGRVLTCAELRDELHDTVVPPLEGAS